MLTVRQASHVLSVSPSLVYGLIARGHLRCERYGLGRGTIRISEEALTEYRERARTAAAVVGSPTPAAAAPPLLRCPPLKHVTLSPAAPARGGTPATGKGAGSASRASTGPSAPQVARR